MTDAAFPSRAELERAVEYSGVSSVTGAVVHEDDLMALLAVAQWALDLDEPTPAMLETGRAAVENALVSLRDARISLPTRGNGLVIREATGEASSTIRMGPEDCLRTGLRAMRLPPFRDEAPQGEKERE